jgi:3-dehydroquinate synthase
MNRQSGTEMKELTVHLGERSYPIYIGEGLTLRAGELLRKRGIDGKSPLMIVSDEQVAAQYLKPLTDVLQAEGYSVNHYVVPAGEKSKSLTVLEEIVTSALRSGLDRKSVFIALGGGVVGDLAGFAAAVYMRGVRFVQMPTTILAHDSSVGGKVAVNHKLAKNMIGAFHQPEAVIYDLSTLQTLPEREVRAGLAEVVKHGLIWDRDFVMWCEQNAERLLSLDMEALQYALYQGCRIKAHIVSQDERESGLRAVLNLGHTIGHALEAVARYDEFLHGEAVAIGMVGAARLARYAGFSGRLAAEVERILQKFNLPVRIPRHMDTDEIMAAMMHDKKFKEGRMVFVIPAEIGRVEIRSDISAAWVREVVEQLKQGE